MSNQPTQSEITPALSKDVTFTEKVNAVDTALKTRANAMKDIKQKWANIVKLLVKYDVKVPYRRLDAAGAANLVTQVEILEPEAEALKDKEAVDAACSNNYALSQVMQGKLGRYLEKKFPGFIKLGQQLGELHDLSKQDREVDETKTKDARTEIQTAIDAYLAALESYDETVEQVADVKEYISVVKDVAEISAIAQGQQLRTN
jgi:predicted RNase H-like HicB family nuclease